MNRRQWYAWYSSRKNIYWRLLRWWFIKRRGERCQWCGKVGSVQLHHRRYWINGVSILWWEWMYPQHMLLLCRSCHDQAHIK